MLLLNPPFAFLRTTLTHPATLLPFPLWAPPSPCPPTGNLLEPPCHHIPPHASTHVHALLEWRRQWGICRLHEDLARGGASPRDLLSHGALWAIVDLLQTHSKITPSPTPDPGVGVRPTLIVT
uniref:Uncharacterized protein n=1 Tax=Eutreptiella gymnastica TaxID=73025 RepID=A0A7S1N642_9EUGL|mmetsp:Transcript_127829/g.220952  ORF Transcript_127829/g.220952 Transcript_127829/m.220952 type:complete len:123 (+) Transcript_127829:295-663(+)